MPKLEWHPVPDPYHTILMAYGESISTGPTGTPGRFRIILTLHQNTVNIEPSRIPAHHLKDVAEKLLELADDVYSP